MVYMSQLPCELDLTLKIHRQVTSLSSEQLGDTACMYSTCVFSCLLRVSLLVSKMQDILINFIMQINDAVSGASSISEGEHLGLMRGYYSYCVLQGSASLVPL